MIKIMNDDNKILSFNFNILIIHAIRIVVPMKEFVKYEIKFFKF